MCALLAFAPASYAACTTNIPHFSSKRFVDNGDGTVTDTSLKLMWMRCELGALWDTTKKSCVFSANDHPRLRLSWQGALKETQKFNAAGGFVAHADWRMPNIKELGNLIDYSCLNGDQVGIDPSVFPLAAADVWSNTPGAAARSNGAKPPVYFNTAWMVYFNQGKLLDEPIDDPDPKNASLHYVRLVRDVN